MKTKDSDKFRRIIFYFQTIGSSWIFKKVDDSLTNDYYDYIVVVATQRPTTQIE